MDKNLYHPYINKDGKLVSGAASLNHYIHTVKGSVQKYNDEIGAEYVSKFVEVYSDVINAGLAHKAKREEPGTLPSLYIQSNPSYHQSYLFLVFSIIRLLISSECSFIHLLINN